MKRLTTCWLMLVAGVANAGETVETLVEKARSAPLAERVAAIERLGLMRAEPGLEALKAAVEATDLEVRLATIEALGRFAREDLLPVLAAQAGSDDPRISGDAIRAMEKTGFAALPHLVPHLTHRVNGVADAALQTACRICRVRTTREALATATKQGGGDRFAFFASLYAADAHPRASTDILRALPDDPKAAALLVRALESEFEPVRDIAEKRLEALACRECPDAAAWKSWLARAPEGPIVEWRASSLRDPQNPARLAAARALAVPDRLAVEALLDAVADPDLRETALASLPEATGLTARADWTGWWKANRERSRADWLLAALVDPSHAPDRAAAARALRTEKDPRAVEFLLAYSLRDPEENVRATARVTLQALAPDRLAAADAAPRR